jgi:hypothetical protein
MNHDKLSRACESQPLKIDFFWYNDLNHYREEITEGGDLSTETLTSAGILFRFSGEAFQHVSAWQMTINQEILRYQVETRGHALVRASNGGAIKITEVPALGEREPYYGIIGGAYRYTFHPIETADFSGCELEVFNQMAGFAYFYPHRLDPLILRVPEPPELLLPGGPKRTASLRIKTTGLLRAGEARFIIPDSAMSALAGWPWYGRNLSAYDFIFTPTANHCLIRVRARSSDAFIDLVREETV